MAYGLALYNNNGASIYDPDYVGYRLYGTYNISVDTRLENDPGIVWWLKQGLTAPISIAVTDLPLFARKITTYAVTHVPGVTGESNGYMTYLYDYANGYEPGTIEYRMYTRDTYPGTYVSPGLTGIQVFDSSGDVAYDTRYSYVDVRTTHQVAVKDIIKANITDSTLSGVQNLGNYSINFTVENAIDNYFHISAHGGNVMYQYYSGSTVRQYTVTGYFVRVNATTIQYCFRVSEDATYPYTASVWEKVTSNAEPLVTLTEIAA